MGNVRSVFLCRDADIDWHAYIAEPWRSERMRDLDHLGGLERPAIRRGNSMTAKLEYLQTAVQKQGDTMQDALLVAPKPRANARRKHELVGKFELKTEQRAREREEFDDIMHIPQASPSTWGGLTPEQQEKERQLKLAARSKMFEYARNAQASSKFQHSTSIASSDGRANDGTASANNSRKFNGEVTLEVVDYAMHVQERASDSQRQLRGRPSVASDRASDAGSSRPLLRPAKDSVAVWRLRIHRARRRAIMVVLTVVRLKRGFNHPKRMQRVDSFGYCIPLVLNDEYGRFIEEQARYGAISDELQDCKEEMDDVLKALLHQGIQTASGLPLAAPPGSSNGLSSARLTKQASRRTHSAATGNAADRSSNSDEGGIITGAGSSMRSLSASASAAATSAAAAAAEADVDGPAPSGPSLTIPMASGPSLTTLVEEDSWVPTGRPPPGGNPAGPVLGPGGVPLRPALAGRRASRNGEGNSSGAGGPSASTSLLPSPTGNASVGRRAVRISEGGETYVCGQSGAAASPSAPANGILGNGSIVSPTLGRRARVSEGGVLGPSGTVSLLGQQGRRRAALLSGGAVRSSSMHIEEDDPEEASGASSTASPVGIRSRGADRGGVGGNSVTAVVSDSAASFTFRLSVGSSASGAADPPDPDLSRDPLFSRRDNRGPPSSSSTGSQGHRSGAGMEDQQLSRSTSTGTTSESAQTAIAAAGVRGLSHHGGDRQHGDKYGPGSASSNGRRPKQASTSMVVRMPRASDPSSLASGAGVALQHSPSMRASTAGGTQEGGEGMKQLRRSTENAKMAMLARRMEQHADQLTKCELMLGMFVNRANAAWAEQQRNWKPAQHALASAGDLAVPEGSEDFRVYKADLIRKLRAGQVVFQIFAAEDVVTIGASSPSSAPGAGAAASGLSASSQGSSGSGGTTMDLWTSDPWNIVAAARPGSMPIAGERLEGLSMGGRVLMQLRTAVETVAGPEAAAALTVVLHVHDGQRDAVVRELGIRKMYGLRRENLFLTVQQRRSGYRYDPDHGMFTPLENTAEQRSLGPGYAMMQLCWVSDAYTIGEPPECQLIPLPSSLVETLQKRGVEWLISRRSSDLSLFSTESAVSVPLLVQALHLRDKARATMVTEVTHTSNMSIMRHLDSLVLNMRPSSSSTSGYGPIKANRVPQGVVELRCSEVASTAMVDVVAHVRSEAPGNELLVGLHRYAFHLPSLAVVLSDINVFRPKLMLAGATVHIGIELSDLTSAPRSRCMALPAPTLLGPGASSGVSLITGGSNGGAGSYSGGAGSGGAGAAGALPLLTSAAEVEELVPLLQVQDNDLDFRKAVAGCRAASIRSHDSPPVSRGAPGILPKPPSPSSPPKTDFGMGTTRNFGASGPQRIVIFIADNDVSQTAVEFVAMFARPGRDEVYLMTVVPSDMHQEAGQQLMMRFFRTLSRCMIQPRVDVVSKGYSGLLDCLERYVTSVDATLVVMGSQAVTSQAAMGGSVPSFGGAANSVMLSCVKRLPLPIVVVTANTRLQQGDHASRGSSNGAAASRVSKARITAVAETHAKGMLHFLALSGFLDALRGDKVFLGQVFPSGRTNLSVQQLQAAKRVLDTFSDVAAGYHLSSSRALLDGPFDKALHSHADLEALHLLALQPKPGDKVLPAEVLSLIRSCKAAIMIYRDRPGASMGQ